MLITGILASLRPQAVIVLAGTIAACTSDASGPLAKEKDGSGGASSSTAESGVSVSATGTGGSGGGSQGSGGVGGTAIDLMTDPKNCGATDHDCLGGACLTGKCQPVLLTSDYSVIAGPIADKDHVHLLGLSAGLVFKGIVSFPHAGGPAIKVASGALDLGFYPKVSGVDSIASEGDTIFYNYDYSTYSGVAQLSKSSGAAESIVETTARVPFTADGTTIYWADESGVWRRPISGTVPELWVGIEGLDVLGAMISDGDAIHVASGDTVYSIAKQDGAVLELGKILSNNTNQGYISALSINQSTMAIAKDDASACGSGPVSTVWTVMKNQPGSAKKIATGERVNSVASTPGYVYWIEQCTGTLNATTSQGSSSVVLSKNRSSANTFVTTWEGIVYWRVEDEVYKLVE